MQNIEDLQSSLLALIDTANDLAALEAARLEALGKKGRFAQAMQVLGSLPAEERKPYGAAVNIAKEAITAALAAREASLQAAALEQRLATETLDVSLPVITNATGSIHPITQTMDEITAIFADMGFTLADGPDIEDDFHNFEALNFAADHPARQMHDTFYLPPDSEGKTRLLRTHTSNVQIRTMRHKQPPIRVFTMGRTFRSDYLDQTHSPMFHQMEALVIDEHTNMGHLRGTLLEFLRLFFQNDGIEVRFRPSYFPFTEPSAEVDMKRPNGKWMEMGGSGMVHPNVLRNCGIDPDRYQGFAWGVGIDRLAMLKNGIDDLRGMFDADIRWLKHYGFSALQQPNLATGL